MMDFGSAGRHVPYSQKAHAFEACFVAMVPMK
jgi:hypothetical protein